MKRLINLTNGNTHINLDRVVNNVSKYRISQFEWTGTTSSQTVHVKIDNDTKNYDESNNINYNLFFMCYANGSITYTPAMDDEGWFHSSSLSSHNILIYVDGTVSGDISSRKCYIELEYR